ncbi:hypothetical protein FACS1894200_03780 [Spirochaetia bacterium]|nr:hypothetical protein FACS1894200_03780 [Spirochaetia bacterium]
MIYTQSQANRIIESLRKGIPPAGFIRDFTVGRENEIALLRLQLKNKDSALLLNANYGSGKSHLIRFIREEALEQKYAVSVVDLDAKNGIRFNRMDQIFIAVCRNIEILVDGNIQKLKSNIIKQYLEDIKPSSLPTNGYKKSWSALRKLNNSFCLVGLRGLVLLFDEFEDILTNLTNINYQEQCFYNLFAFCGGKEYNGKTFFAVTPDFIDKCKKRLSEKDKDDFNIEAFNNLRQFQMSPLEEPSLIELGKKIAAVHGIAYNWDTSKFANKTVVSIWLKEAASVRIQDRTRQCVKVIVSVLDNILQDDE